MSSLKKSFFLALVGVAGALSGCFVNDDHFFVPGNFFTIQEAVDFSRPGDTVFIENGVYSPFTNGERFPIFMKDGVNLVGEDPERTIIDADNTDYIFDVFNYSGKIENFTLQNGIGNLGGAMFIQNSDVILRRLFIVANRADEAGSGIYIKDSDGSILENLVIAANARFSSSPNFPAQVEVVGTDLSFTNNTVANGDDDGIRLRDGSTGFYENNIFYQNGSEGLGVGFADLDPTTTAEIRFNVCFGNPEADFYLNGMNLSAQQANDLDPNDFISENFSADPFFVNPGASDFNLQSGSPALHAGDPDPSFNNQDGSRNTIGSTGGPQAEDD